MFDTSEALEKELENTITNDKRKIIKLVQIARGYRVGFQFVNSYLKLFTVILEDVVEQASLSYNNAESGHSFGRHTQLLVAQKFAQKIKKEGIVF